MNKKETIIKILTIFMGSFGVSLLPIAIVLSAFLPLEKALDIMKMIFNLFIGLGLLYVTLLIVISIVISIKGDSSLFHPDKAEPDRFSFPTPSYNLFLANLLPKLSANGYQKHTTVAISDGCEIAIFFGSARFSHLDCFVLIHSQEFLAEWENPIQDTLSQEIHQLFGRELFTPHINIIFLFCSDRSSADYQNLFNLNTQQYPQLSQFFAGVVFEEETLYIARQVDGFAPLKYKKLRKKFLKMIDLPNLTGD